MLGINVIGFVVLLGALILLCFYLIECEVNWEKARAFWVTDFDSQWPPISDEEFLRRCPKGSSRTVALKVREIVSETLNIPHDQVYPEQSLIEDLKAE